MDAVTIHDMLMRASLLLDDGDNQALREFGLNRTQYLTLQLLDEQQGQRLVDMATTLLCERSTITRIIDYFEQQGWAQRLADAEDRRSQRVVLKPAGITLREKAKLVYEESLQQRFRKLNDEEQKQLAALLHKLQADLSKDLGATKDLADK